MTQYTVQQSALSHFLFADKRMAWVWLLVRLYLGWEWLMAGWEKFQNPAWVGGQVGTALTGFIQGALAKTGGAHPDVQWWYASFLQSAVLPNAVTWSYLVTYGEMLVGVGLLLGCVTGVAIFFGMFMNLNFMLAGSVSVNPIWFTLGIGVILAWRTAGYIGLDRWVLPMLRRSLRLRPKR